eukprot:TRINITY_DN2907_c0_g1_i1.p1 TRINITY_DN2907_c0_g1~~TRINITY_DN2907_c0_g1_i1.p1  ORF type:complete len:342 (-),score=62.11 TRINITY_DN2907_c0_g1_i1:97-1092(-)
MVAKKKSTNSTPKKAAKPATAVKKDAKATNSTKATKIAPIFSGAGNTTTTVTNKTGNSINQQGGKKDNMVDCPKDLKIFSWNIAGFKAVSSKGTLEAFLNKFDSPPIVCLQETKSSDIALMIKSLPGYYIYSSAAEKAGYAGTLIASKIKPVSVTYGLGKDKHDNEGRMITLEFPEFYLIATYIPNSGRGLVRLDYRQEWEADFLENAKNLDKKKPVIWTGDTNVAHGPNDLANPKSNAKNAGYTKEERACLTKFLSEGFIDTWRKRNGEDAKKYSFWSYIGGARAKNVGWRLDYFIVSNRFDKKVTESLIHGDVMGSDHCPLHPHELGSQ